VTKHHIPEELNPQCELNFVLLYKGRWSSKETKGIKTQIRLPVHSGHSCFGRHFYACNQKEISNKMVSFYFGGL
jgi:hypothetical protein